MRCDAMTPLAGREVQPERSGGPMRVAVPTKMVPRQIHHPAVHDHAVRAADSCTQREGSISLMVSYAFFRDLNLADLFCTDRCTEKCTSAEPVVFRRRLELRLCARVQVDMRGWSQHPAVLQHWREQRRVALDIYREQRGVKRTEEDDAIMHEFVDY